MLPKEAQTLAFRLLAGKVVKEDSVRRKLDQKKVQLEKTQINAAVSASGRAAAAALLNACTCMPRVNAAGSAPSPLLLTPRIPSGPATARTARRKRASLLAAAGLCTRGPASLLPHAFSMKPGRPAILRLMQVKEDLKTVALGTSKINYLDPRITVAW